MIYQRQKTIIDFLQKKKTSTIKELSKIAWASESSIRRDIKELEHKGYVTQVYGGVILSEFANNVIPISLRDSSNTTAKDIIAKESAKHIFNGATIFMDGSSTVKRIMKYINSFKDLKIITNSHLIFSECKNPNIDLYCTGGRFDTKSNIFLGRDTEKYIENINADIVFFSSQAISNDGKISDVSEEETSLRRTMLSHAQKKIFLCDSSKIGLTKTFILCTKDDINLIISDKKMPWEL